MIITRERRSRLGFGLEEFDVGRSTFDEKRFRTVSATVRHLLIGPPFQLDYFSAAYAAVHSSNVERRTSNKKGRRHD